MKTIICSFKTLLTIHPHYCSHFLHTLFFIENSPLYNSLSVLFVKGPEASKRSFFKLSFNFHDYLETIIYFNLFNINICFLQFVVFLFPAL